MAQAGVPWLRVGSHAPHLLLRLQLILKITQLLPPRPLPLPQISRLVLELCHPLAHLTHLLLKLLLSLNQRSWHTQAGGPTVSWGGPIGTRGGAGGWSTGVAKCKCK